MDDGQQVRSYEQQARDVRANLLIGLPLFAGGLFVWLFVGTEAIALTPRDAVLASLGHWQQPLALGVFLLFLGALTLWAYLERRRRISVGG